MSKSIDELRSDDNRSSRLSYRNIVNIVINRTTVSSIAGYELLKAAQFLQGLIQYVPMDEALFRRARQI